MAGATRKPVPGMQRTSGASRRRLPVTQRRNRPWGWIAGLAVVVLAAAGLVGYAATRPSAGDIAGVASYPNLSRDHVTGPVSYPQTPPAGGNHSADALTCGVYTQPVPNENAVHSLEHGALWITYRPGLPAGQITTLARLVRGNDHRLLSPYPGLPAPVVATAWGKQLRLDSATDPKLAKFAAVFTQGPTTPEPGAACQGVGTPTG